MNMSRMALNVATVSVLLAAAGCANGRIGRSEYLPDGEVISGRADEATVYDLDTAIQSLMTGMREHQTFVRNYGEIKAKRNDGKPILQVLSIDCNSCMTPRPSTTKLAMVRDKICQSVFESDLFALRDSVVSEALQNAEVPDCVLRGTLMQVTEETRRRGRGCNVYRLQLVLTDAKSSAVIWQGAHTIVKIDWLFR